MFNRPLVVAWSIFSFLVATNDMSPAHGAVKLVNDGRGIRLEAQGNSDFGGDQAQYEYFALDNGEMFNAFGAGDDLFAPGAQSARGASKGSITASAVTESGFAASGEVEGQATVFDETAHDAFAGASSQLQVGFTLDAVTKWRLLATLSGSTHGIALAELREGFTSAGAELFSWTHLTNPGINEVLTLAPGDYTLTVRAGYAMHILAPEVRNASASFAASFAVVPEPGVIALAGIACIALLAPRRISARHCSVVSS
jgi:hypothetical protein